MERIRKLTGSEEEKRLPERTPEESGEKEKAPEGTPEELNRGEEKSQL